MAVFNEPTKWQTSLVNSGDANTIPQSTPAGTGEASFDDGFPQITQVPIGAGGIAPDRKDFNGLFKILGDWIFFAQNGGIPSYDPDFDYVVGRMVLYTDGNLYKCKQANTVTVGGQTIHVAPDSVDPVGTDYWQQLDGENTSTSLIPNQIITSPVPLTDANLHLLDGALLSGSGAYSAYVAMMADLYNADPTATCWTDEASWQASVTQYGVCGKFVYDSVSNTVRLPKFSNKIYTKDISSTASVIGNGITLGLTDGTHYAGLIGEKPTGGSVSYAVPFISGYGATVGSNPTRTGSFTNSISYGLTTDPAKSGIITDLSDITTSLDIYYYVVIGTVSKTDIQIDIDQIANDLNGKADTDFANINDTAKNAIAHNAMPSATIYDDLTLGTSGDSYTAPSDGYVCFVKEATASGQYISLASTLLQIVSYSPTSNGTLRAFIPVKKGENFTVGYSAVGTTSVFRFVYAVGSESEQ